MKVGVHVLPRFAKDTTDRNRHRLLPSPATNLNSGCRLLPVHLGSQHRPEHHCGEELSLFADALEGSSDFTADLNALIKKTIREHKRIIFNGNGYDDSWVAERKGGAFST